MGAGLFFLPLESLHSIYRICCIYQLKMQKKCAMISITEQRRSILVRSAVS